MPTGNSNQPSFAEQIKATLTQEVKIQRHKLSTQDMMDFVKHIETERKNDPKKEISLSDYVADTFYKGQKNIVAIPDLTGTELVKNVEGNFPEYINLSGVDFSGSIIKNTKFDGCDLTGSIFTDTDLQGAYFDNTKLKDVDFRGSELANCEFGESYNYAIEPEIDSTPDDPFSTMGSSPEDYADTRADIKRHQLETARYNQKIDHQKKFISGIKFSTSHDLAKLYADAKDDKAREKEHTQLKLEKSKEVDRLYSKLSYAQRAWVSTGSPTGNEQYDKAALELSDMQKGIYPKKDYLIHKTFDRLFDGYAPSFDPCYKRGSSATERTVPKKYIKTSREDLETYLDALKSNPQLTLNDFVKEQFISKGGKIEEGTIIHADLSGRVDSDNNLIPTDLKDLDFTGAHLQSTNFSGTDITNANFTNANISNTNFESSIALGAIFENTTARDVNFFNADLAFAKINNSDFLRTYMPKSIASGLTISNSCFDYSNIRKGQWNGINMDSCTLNYANLEGISLANAVIRKTEMQHVILNNAILEQCKIIESDLTGAFIEESKADTVTLMNTVLKDIEGTRANLSQAIITQYASEETINALLESKETDFPPEGLLDKIRSDIEQFKSQQRDNIDSLWNTHKDKTLENINLRHSYMENAFIEGINASNIDATGAAITNLKAKGTSIKESIFNEVVATNADFTSSAWEKVDATGAEMERAILNEIKLKKVKLQNTNLKQAQLKNATLQDVTVNAATNMLRAETAGAEGHLWYETQDRTTKVSIDEHVQNCENIEHAKKIRFGRKWAGAALKGMGYVSQKTGDFFAGSLPPRWARIVGAVIAIAITVPVVATLLPYALAASATSFTAMAIIGGSAIVAGSAGAAIGHYTTKALTGFTAVSAVAGGATAGPAGAAMGTGAALAFDTIIEQTTGRTFSAWGGLAANKVGKATEDLGKEVGISREQEQSFKEYSEAKSTYKERQKEEAPKAEQQAQAAKEQKLDALHDRSKFNAPSATSKSAPKPAPQSFVQALQAKAKNLVSSTKSDNKKKIDNAKAKDKEPSKKKAVTKNTQQAAPAK